MAAAGGDGAADGGGQAQEPAPWRDYSTVFTNAKAGMSQVDKEHVQRVVYEMSKDSAHFKNEERKQAAVAAKISALQQRAARLTPGELAAHTRAMDARLTALELKRDLSRTWVCVDMDAFFAACEVLDRPDLTDKPFAVGGMGMISTASYAARRFGVRSAMPGFIGRRLCPHLVFVRPDFEKYTAASRLTREVFRLFDPGFEAGSLDEAFLDVTDYCREHSLTGEQAAAQLRGQMRESTRLTCSCGVAPNKLLAKVCSDINKPDGQYVLAPTREAVTAFIATLPIRKVPGVGKVTEQTCKALGVATCGQLREHRALVAALFKPATVEFFQAVMLGLGETRHAQRPAGNEPDRKGISVERTFAALSSREDLQAMLERLTGSLAEDMAAEGLEARNLTLKLKATSFEVRTRALTLPHHVHAAAEMLPHLTKLLAAEMPIEIRLMGVRASTLRKIGSGGGAQQPSAMDLLLRLGGGGAERGAQQQGALPHELPRHSFCAHTSGMHFSRADGAVDPLLSVAGLEGAGAGAQSPTSSGDSEGCAAMGDPPLPSPGHRQQAEGSHDGAAVQADAAASSSDAAAEASAAQAPAKRQRVGPAGGAAPGRAWACSLCTYAGNHRLSLRCDMCSTPKSGPLMVDGGMGPPPPLGVARQAAAAAAMRQAAQQARAGPAAAAAAGGAAPPLPAPNQLAPAPGDTAQGEAMCAGGAVVGSAAGQAVGLGVVGEAGDLDAMLDSEVMAGSGQQAAALQHGAGEEGSPAREAGAGGPPDGSAPCQLCGCLVEAADAQLHEDWHLALQLQQQERRAAGAPAAAPRQGTRGGAAAGAGKRAGSKAARGQGQGHHDTQQPLERFFSRGPGRP